jgi:hypothetical protein
MFDGRNVTSFLRKYESMCDNYQIQEPLRLKKVSEYCEDNIAREIETFTTWEEQDWKKLKKEMLHEWRREDTEQMMHTRAFLEEYVSKPRSKEGLKRYCRQYDRISKVLVRKNELDVYSQGRLFVIGLPAEVRYEVLSEQEVCSPTGWVNYLEALKAAKAIVETEEKLEHFVVQPERQTSISNLAERLNEAKPAPSSTEKKDRWQEDMVELITKTMGALTSPIAAAATEMQTAVANMSPKQMPVDRPMLRPRRPFCCFFCEEEGHLKSRCPRLRRLINAGSVHLDEDLRICLGPPRPRAMPIQRVPGMTLLQAVERQVKMKEAPISASVGFRMIRADLEEDSDVEVARPAQGVKTCRQQVQLEEETRRRHTVASEGQTRGQHVPLKQTQQRQVASGRQTRQQQAASEPETRRRQEVALEDIERQKVVFEGQTCRQQVQQGQTWRPRVALEDMERYESVDMEDWWRIERKRTKKKQPEFTVPRRRCTAKSRIGLSGLGGLGVGHDVRQV